MTHYYTGEAAERQVIGSRMKGLSRQQGAHSWQTRMQQAGKDSKIAWLEQSHIEGEKSCRQGEAEEEFAQVAQAR